jgi:hypothetical protein
VHRQIQMDVIEMVGVGPRRQHGGENVAGARLNLAQKRLPARVGGRRDGRRIERVRMVFILI